MSCTGSQSWPELDTRPCSWLLSPNRAWLQNICVSSCLNRHHARSSRPLRSADRCDLLIPWSHTSLSQNRAFAVVGPALWNDTPPALRSVMLLGDIICVS